MWHIRRIDPFDCLAGRRFVALVGGGGKTSLMEYLAARAVARGLSAALTTTTKIFVKEPFVLFGPGDEPPKPPKGRFLHIGGGLEKGKLTALSFDAVRRLGQSFDLVLVEADGAKGRPLKCPAPHEPVIPPFTDMVFVVAGLDGLGGTVEERLFRWEILAGEGRVDAGTAVDATFFGDLFSPRCMMKATEGLPRMVVLNKYDALARRSDAREAAKAVASRAGCPVIFGSIRFKSFFRLAGTAAENEKRLAFSR